MDSADSELINLTQDHMWSLFEEGEIADVEKVVEDVVAEVRQDFEEQEEIEDPEERDPANRVELSDALKLQADTARDLEKLSEASALYDEAIELMAGTCMETERLARLHSGRAFCADHLEENEIAVEHYQQAIVLYESYDPPAEMDVADLSTSLAFVLKRLGQLDEAETIFLKALNICHSTLGDRHEQTASLFESLGDLYYEGKFYDQSREILMMALESRRYIFGEHHVETAQSHATLALALAKTDDQDWADKHFRRSVEILQDKAVTHLEELEGVVIHYLLFLREQGRQSHAKKLEKSMVKIRKKVAKMLS